MKFTIIRRVSFKTPGNKPRIVWANVLCERDGLALMMVPALARNGPHSIYIAQENVAERVFESIGPYRFDLESEDLTEAGERLRMLGKSIEQTEFWKMFRPDDFPPFP